MLNALKMGEFEARDSLLLLMVLLENFHVFNCRSEYISAVRIPLQRNWLLIGGVVAAQGIHILAMHLSPTQALLRVAPLSLREYLLLFAIASSILVVMELFKLVNNRIRSHREATVSS
jgi:hypothetical protein